jgi:hydroxypyruvate reductase
VIDSVDALRDALVDAVAEALAALDPAALVEAALPPLPPRHARVLVVAAGKAALAMTRGALARWPDRIEEVVTATGGHPTPDAESVASAERALARAATLGPRDLLLALVSGGASSMLAAPAAPMTLADKRALVAALLDGGTPIRDVNLVRRHVSRVKGGRLALAANAARVLTLALSDVVGGAPQDIGSGPTVPDPTTCDDALAVLARAGIAPPSGLGESVKPGEIRARARILADPAALSREVARALARRGLLVTEDPPDEGDARAIADARVARAAGLAPGEAVVIATEPTLALPPSRGRGGRAGWVALASMVRLPEGVTLLCAASDGVDGTSGASGAVVSQRDAARAGAARIQEALAAFDDASVHDALGTHLPGGPTGHNLADVHVLARLASPRP